MRQLSTRCLVTTGTSILTMLLVVLAVSLRTDVIPGANAQLSFPTNTSTHSLTHTPTITPGPTRTKTPTITPGPIRTKTHTPTITPGPTRTKTPTITPGQTRTHTPTVTPIMNRMPMPGANGSRTQTATPSMNRMPMPGASGSRTQTATPSMNRMPMPSVTRTVSKTVLTTATRIPFPTVSITFVGSRSVDPVIYAANDIVTIVAQHASVQGGVRQYRWTIGSSNVQVTTTANFQQRYNQSQSVTVLVVPNSATYNNGTASSRFTVRQIPTGGSLTANATTAVSLTRIILNCRGWRYSSSATPIYTFYKLNADNSSQRAVAETTSQTSTVTVELVSANTTVRYACTVEVGGLRSNLSSAAAIAVTTVTVTSATVNNLVRSIPQLNSTTSAPTMAQRATFADDLNAAASALANVNTSDASTATTMLARVSAGAAAITNTTALSVSEKDVYTYATQETLRKITTVSTTVVNQVNTVVAATATVPLSSTAAVSLVTTLASLVTLLLRANTQRRQLLVATATDYRLAQAYTGAFSTARAFLMSPGNSGLGTRFNTNNTAFAMRSVLSTESQISQYLPNEIISPAQPSSMVRAAVVLEPRVTSFYNSTASVRYGFGLGNQSAYIPAAVTLNLSSFYTGSNIASVHVNVWNGVSDTSMACTVTASSRTAACPRIATTRPPPYFFVNVRRATPTATPTSTTKDSDGINIVVIIVPIVVVIVVVAAIVGVVLCRRKGAASDRDSNIPVAPLRGAGAQGREMKEMP